MKIIVIVIIFLALAYLGKKTYCTRWWQYNGKIVFKCKGFTWLSKNISTYGIYLAVHVEKEHLQMALRQLNLINIWRNFYVALPAKQYKKYRKKTW